MTKSLLPLLVLGKLCAGTLDATKAASLDFNENEVTTTTMTLANPMSHFASVIMSLNKLVAMLHQKQEDAMAENNEVLYFKQEPNVVQHATFLRGATKPVVGAAEPCHHSTKGQSIQTKDIKNPKKTKTHTKMTKKNDKEIEDSSSSSYYGSYGSHPYYSSYSYGSYGAYGYYYDYYGSYGDYYGYYDDDDEPSFSYDTESYYSYYDTSSSSDSSTITSSTTDADVTSSTGSDIIDGETSSSSSIMTINDDMTGVPVSSPVEGTSDSSVESSVVEDESSNSVNGADVENSSSNPMDFSSSSLSGLRHIHQAKGPKEIAPARRPQRVREQATAAVKEQIRPRGKTPMTSVRGQTAAAVPEHQRVEKRNGQPAMQMGDSQLVFKQKLNLRVANE